MMSEGVGASDLSYFSSLHIGKRCRQGGSLQDGRAQCRMPAAGCSCLVLLFDGSEKRDGGFVCGGGRVVKKGGMRFSFCLIWVCCYVHGPRIRGERGTCGFVQ